MAQSSLAVQAAIANGNTIFTDATFGGSPHGFHPGYNDFLVDAFARLSAAFPNPSDPGIHAELQRVGRNRRAFAPYCAASNSTPTKARIQIPLGGLRRIEAPNPPYIT